MRGRLIETTLGDPVSNVALEEALFLEMELPVLRVWENQRAVVIGRAQVAEFETDLEYCRDHGIPVVRRFTGGGAVYHGPGNFNWSFFIPGGRWAVADAKGVFASFAASVVGALRECGVEGEFVPPNSVAVLGGKVSGMAAYISKRGVLCHGTLLASADLREVQRLTTPREGHPGRRYARSRNVPVTNCGVDRDRFVDALVRSSGGDFEAGVLTQAEETRLVSLLRRYGNERWNLGDPFGLDDL